MTLPDYQNVILPLLRFAAQKGTEISTSDAVEALAKELGLTEDDLRWSPYRNENPTEDNRGSFICLNS